MLTKRIAVNTLPVSLLQNLASGANAPLPARIDRAAARMAALCPGTNLEKFM